WIVHSIANPHRVFVGTLVVGDDAATSESRAGMVLTKLPLVKRTAVRIEFHSEGMIRYPENTLILVFVDPERFGVHGGILIDFDNYSICYWHRSLSLGSFAFKHLLKARIIHETIERWVIANGRSRIAGGKRFAQPLLGLGIVAKLVIDQRGNEHHARV